MFAVRCCQLIVTTFFYFVRKLLKHVQIVKKISARHDAKRTEQSAEGEEQPACCRPHTFLQR